MQPHGHKIPELGGTPSLYSFHDEFNDTRAPGALNGTPATPGVGNRVVIDTNNKVSIGSGVLNFATGAAANDGVWEKLFTREVGKMLLAKITPANTAGIPAFGWDVDQTGAITDALIFNTATGAQIVANGGTAFTIFQYVAGSDYLIMAAMRATGIYWFVKGAGYTHWTLIAKTTLGSAGAYPAITAQNATSVFTADQVRVPKRLWLPAPLASDGFSGAATDGLGHAETTGLGAGGSGLTWTGSTWTVASGVATNAPGLNATNLITDGDMEAVNMSAWTTVGTPTTLDKSGVQKHGGAQSVRIIASAAGDGFKQSITPPANHWYRVSAWLYGQGGTFGVNLWKDSSNVGFNRAASWVQMSGTFYSTGAAVEIKFTSRDAGTPTLYVDDVVVQQINDADLFRTLALTTPDVMIQTQLTALGGGQLSPQGGLVMRLDSTANPQNYLLCYQQNWTAIDTRIKLVECVGGVYSANIINFSHAYAVNDLLCIWLNGSAVRVYSISSAGVITLAGSGTTNVLTGNIHGLFGTGLGLSATDQAKFDNFHVFAVGNEGQYD